MIIGDLLPIDTEYKDRLFRSRLEAKYAVYLENLGWNWEYEVEGFQLPSGWYLPDFYFPDLKCFAEVKPDVLTDEELKKCKELSLQMRTSNHSIDVLLFEGFVKPRTFRTISQGQVFDNVILGHKESKFYPFFFTEHFLRKQFVEETVAFVKAIEARFEREWKEL